MRHIMIKDVSAPSGVSLNDLMVILRVSSFLGHTVLICHNYEFYSKHANFI